jgi:hypothetical protein
MQCNAVCPRCGSTDYIHSGWAWRKVKGEDRSVQDLHRHICRDCGKYYRVQETREEKNK